MTTDQITQDQDLLPHIGSQYQRVTINKYGSEQ